MSKDVVVRMLDVDSIVLDPTFKTRTQDHDSDGVERIAKSFMYRAQHGIEPVQMNDIIVAPGEKDTFKLVDGEGRYRAALLVNEAGGIDGEPMQLRAKIVRGDNYANSLITGLQANFHDAIDVFDQADVAGKLIDTGMKQKEVAGVLAVTEGRISQILPLRKVAKKYVQAYRDGDLEQDAVIAIANMDADDNTRQEVMEEAMRHREKITAILARREHKAKKEEVITRIAEAKGKVDEFTQTTKELDKKVKELDKAAAETKNKKDLEKVRQEKEKLEAERKAAEKALRDADKDLAKAKEAKEKLAENPPVVKKRATKEDVAEAAKNKGVKGAENVKTAKSKAALIADLEAMTEDEKNPVPESVKNLIARIEGYLDGEDTAKQLRNSFIKSCRDDNEYSRALGRK